MKSILFLGVLIFGLFARAESPFEYRLLNYDVDQQLGTVRASMLPQKDDFSFASDIYLWKYWSDTSSYYHGPGFWTETFVEYRPFADLDVNLKVLAANGSSSFGYNAASGVRPFVGLSWNPLLSDGGWKMLLRFFDLDRTTLGAGLFFQDREMSGGQLGFNNGSWYFDIRLPGTAVLNLSGDLYSVETFYRSSVNDFGFHGFFISDLAILAPSKSNPNVLEIQNSDLDFVSSLFFRSRDTSMWQYKAEAAYRQNQWAGLVGLGLQNLKKCQFCYQSFLQYRSYDAEVLGELSGKTSFEYMPYSLQIRDYHNAISILRVDGRARSSSATLNLKWNISDRHALESLNEVGHIEYLDQAQEDHFYWYRHSFNYCPYSESADSCLKIYVSNKILRVNGLERSFFDNEGIFKRSDVFGVEAVIYL